MRALMSVSVALMLSSQGIAQTQPPPIVFMDETVMSEVRALEVAEVTRQKFWGRVPGFDGKPIEPSSEQEKNSIPLPKWDLLYIAASASYAGDAARCKVSTAGAHLFRLQNQFRPKYMDEKRTQFAFAYSILIYQDVIARMKDAKCSPERAEALREGVDFIAR